MTDKDRTTISREARVAYVLEDTYRRYTGFNSNSPQTVANIAAKKILAMLDEREVPGWVVATACAKHPDVGTDCVPCESYSNIAYPKCRDYGAKTRPAKQHEVNSGLATKEKG